MNAHMYYLETLERQIHGVARHALKAGLTVERMLDVTWQLGSMGGSR